MTKFVNLTPHPIRLRADIANTAAVAADGDIVVVPHIGPDGKPAAARVSSIPGGIIGEASGLTIFGAPTWGTVEGLPAPAEDTIYIVSLLVLEGLRKEGSSRTDVVGPGTGPTDGAVRYGDDAGPRKGQVFAVTRLNSV